MRFHQFVKGVGDVEHSITSLSGLFKVPTRDNDEFESDGQTNDVVSMQGDTAGY